MHLIMHFYKKVCCRLLLHFRSSEKLFFCIILVSFIFVSSKLKLAMISEIDMIDKMLNAVSNFMLVELQIQNIFNALSEVDQFR